MLNPKEQMLSIEVQETKNKNKTFRLCAYCNYYYKKNNIMKCSLKGCENVICKNCATFINDKPFCHVCVLHLIKNKSMLIITKGDI